MLGLRVLIVDDHESVRMGVRAILQSREGIAVCGEAANGREALEKVAELKPDLVILDITMPIMDGFSAARAISKEMPGVSVLLLSMHESPGLVHIAKSSGALGYVAKSEGAATLLRAIDAVVRKQAFFPSLG